MLIKKRSSASDHPSTISVPDAARLKAELVRQMAIIIEEKSLTRRVIAESLGLNQPQVSMMLRGQVKSYAVEQLADFLNILNGRSPQSQPSHTQVIVRTAPITVPPVSKAKNTEEIELKTALVQKMAEEISQRGMTQKLVGELLGFSQPQVSLMLKGRINAYSIDQLSGYLETLRDQNPTQSTPVQVQQRKSAPKPTVEVEDSLESIAAAPLSPLGAPSAIAANGSSVTGMMEEIAYLRQHLVLVGRGDRQVIQAEVELLRRENALLQEKTKRFERMAELLQFA